MIVSIIICTRNRAESLDQTLDALQSVIVPPGLRPEILIIDNGSTDATPAVSAKPRKFPGSLRHIPEPSKGLSRARNAGLREARGEVILFTDDDIRPSPLWLEKMAGPLLEGKFDAAVGRIDLAGEICRPWMTKGYRAGLAFCEGPENGPAQFIGANMGFHRRVLERVPAFDNELGAGALGCFEDTLFSWQLAEAGFTLRYIPDALVTHFPDPTRLLRKHCLTASRTYGASNAYVIHHWKHEVVPQPRLRHSYLGFKLVLRRRLDKPNAPDQEGIAAWEMSYLAEMEKCRHFLVERQRPRNYARRGLVKLRSNERAPATMPVAV